MPVSATNRLAIACMDAGASKELIAAVLRFEFHDFKSPHDLPKMELVRRLLAEGLTDIAERVQVGEFDD